MYSLFQLVYVLAHRLVEGIQPVLVPLCFVIAWVTLIAGSWSVLAAMRDGVQQAQRMHEIPCADCKYFSGSYLLKCPLHPQEALSEAAIACRDFESAELQWPKSSS